MSRPSDTEIRIGSIVLDYGADRHELYIATGPEPTVAAMVEAFTERDWAILRAAQAPITKDVFNLCGECGHITPDEQWTYWHWNDAEDGGDDEWSRPHDPTNPSHSDPMELCPKCGDEHRDSDTDSGMWSGTLAEMIATRAEESETMGWDE